MNPVAGIWNLYSHTLFKSRKLSLNLGTLFKSRKNLKLKIIIMFNTDIEISDNATGHELQIKMNIGKMWMIPFKNS